MISQDEYNKSEIAWLEGRRENDYRVISGQLPTDLHSAYIATEFWVSQAVDGIIPTNHEYVDYVIGCARDLGLVDKTWMRERGWRVVTEPLDELRHAATISLLSDRHA